MNTWRPQLAIPPRQTLAPEVRSYILQDLVAKAAAEDPEHPGWPAGAPGRQGGRFRPKGPTSPAQPDRPAARDIPAYHPKHRVTLLDSQGNPITDAQGNPLLRPADLPPEMFVREGLAIRDKFNEALKQDSGLLLSQATAELIDQLRQFGQGGIWDAQRIQGQAVDEYRDYATIAIGLFAAAAGLPIQIALQIENVYAYLSSNFDEQMDEVYTNLPRRNVRNTEIGYELYQSGRIVVTP